MGWRILASGLLVAGLAACASTPWEDATSDWVTTLARANAILAEAQDGPGAELARDRLVALEHADLRSVRLRRQALSSSVTDPALASRWEVERQRFVAGIERLMGYGREVPDDVRFDLQRLLPAFVDAPE